MRVGTENSVPVLQACGKPVTRTTFSPWMARKDAHYLLMDITFAQTEELPGQHSPLQVHLFDTDTSITTRVKSRVLDLNASKHFPDSVPPDQISNHVSQSLALSLGPVRRSGFRLAFSYSGKCVLITSTRLYYRRCPDTVASLALFKGTGAGSGPVTGSCVRGAFEISAPVRECNEDGVWGPQLGGCTCEPGHQLMDDSCQGMEIR